MSPNRRIALNIIATYGRSLYALVLGIFSARWVLTTLGVEDYGLLGVISGLTAFIAFFNGVLAAAISRFYSYSVGQANMKGNELLGLEECRLWFNTALTIHSVVPLFLLVIGYPIGSWAIHNWLVIPINRVSDCIWLFRFVCLSCFVGMVNVPFRAMYGAKQYIAELTIYSIVSTTVNFCFLVYMINHPGYWLLEFGLWSCCLSIVPQIIIAIRATYVFPECRLKFSYLFRWSYIKQLGQYATWQMIGSFSALLKNQGIALVINKFFGPKVNAAMAIGGTVNAQCQNLSGSMQGAFCPAIVTAYGAGDRVRFEGLVIRTCKFGVILSAIFSIPMLLELPTVMVIWLKTPPRYATGLAAFMLVHSLIENATQGHVVAVQASGKVARYQILMGSISLLTLPIAVVIVYFTNWVYGVCIAMLITLVSYSVLRVILTRQIVKISCLKWVKKVVAPLSVMLVLTFSVGFLTRFFMQASFIRIVITTVVCEIVLIPFAWIFALDDEEKKYLVRHICSRFPILCRFLGGQNV